MRVTIDGHELEVEAGTTVLEAIRSLGGNVPTLCFDDRQAPFGACRVCLVGAAGARGPIPACTTPCREGLEIDTQDPTARRVAAAIVELVLSELPQARTQRPQEMQSSCWKARYGWRSSCFSGCVVPGQRDSVTPSWWAIWASSVWGAGACDEVQGAFALTATGRGFSANVTAGLDAGFRDSSCVSCGACADSCPTDAITEITLLQL